MDIFSYKEIIECFDNNIWDFSYLTIEEATEILNFPVKFSNNLIEQIIVGRYNYPINSIILIVVKYSKDYDYSIDKDFASICQHKLPNLSFSQTYFNLKYAAIKAGLGQYGKNMLFHHPKFDFDIHLAAFVIYNKIIDLPERNKPNFNLLSQCNNCFDCYNACPVKAIHNQAEPFWLDAYKCDNFCYYGNHSQIPSIKWNKIPFEHGIRDKQFIYNIKTTSDYYKHFPEGQRGAVIDNNNEYHYIHYPICRECTSQPKCTKYNGKYPYNWNDIRVLN